MFNISFGEVVVVAVIGLIVIGPKRLPETARFVGHLVSRVQRQVAEVKTDIRREMELEDLKHIHREYENAAREMKNDFDSHAREVRDSVADAANAATTWPGGDSSATAENTTAEKIAGKTSAHKTANDNSEKTSDEIADQTAAAHGETPAADQTAPPESSADSPPRR